MDNEDLVTDSKIFRYLRFLDNFEYNCIIFRGKKVVFGLRHPEE